MNVVLERQIYEALGRVARRDGTSLSSKARDLLRDALELQEDLALTGIAAEREKTYRSGHALGHESIWGPRRREPRR
ncbi:MAG TPA: antitoxin, RHH family protein [Candidatus Dormibacteraeota bacterium]|nr:antitoxin, RHH family protein [Candidatus Dormibacteraeota bacterium]